MTFKQSSANTLDISLNKNNLSPNSASLLIQPIQKTPSIKGFYYILDQGHRTPAIPWNATLDQLYAALHTLPTIEGINVTLTSHPIYTNGGRIISITFLPFNMYFNINRLINFYFCLYRYNTHEKLNIQSELRGEGVDIVVCEGNNNNNNNNICKDIPSHKGSMVSGHFNIVNPTSIISHSISFLSSFLFFFLLFLSSFISFFIPFFSFSSFLFSFLFSLFLFSFFSLSFHSYINI